MSADHGFVLWEEAVMWLRGQPEHAQLVMDCYYDDPLPETARRYWQSEEWGAVRSLLAYRSGHALDAGAGRGIASFALAHEGFQVTALEPDPSNLVGAGAIRSLAAETGLPIQVVENDSEHLPFGDAAFDLIFVRAALHHSSDLEAAVREFFRVLKPGGCLLAIREHVISSLDDLPRFLDQHPLHRLYGGERAYLLQDYLSALSHAGFTGATAISPWRSPINYAPRSLSSLQDEVAHRAAGGIPGLTHTLRSLIRKPAIWSLIRSLLERIDRRPGRLYSFMAEKPRT